MRNGLQILITNKMRKILIQDLKYEPEEIDAMEPRIAAVVIERSLARPTKGMPDTWRRRVQSSKNRNLAQKLKYANTIIRKNTVAAMYHVLNATVVNTKEHLNNPIVPIVVASVVLLRNLYPTLTLVKSASSLLRSRKDEPLRINERFSLSDSAFQNNIRPSPSNRQESSRHHPYSTNSKSTNGDVLTINPWWPLRYLFNKTSRRSTNSRTNERVDLALLAKVQQHSWLDNALINWDVMKHNFF